MVFTASWDKTVKLWDIRSKAGTPTCTLSQEDKVFSMDVSGNMLVVALAGRTIQIYDIRNTAQPYQTREASLKHMLRQASTYFNDHFNATSFSYFNHYTLLFLFSYRNVSLGSLYSKWYRICIRID